VPTTGIMRTLQVGERATPLAQAIAEIGQVGNWDCRERDSWQG
jgi:hypothetical protein